MSALALILVGWAAGQGRALEIAYPNEPGLEAVEVAWSGHEIPFVPEGGQWTAVIGIDLAAKPGEHPAKLTLEYSDGRKRTKTEPLEVLAREFPTTKLKVAPKYVQLSREDQQRAARERAEIKGIYATLSPRRYWSRPFVVPLPGVTGGRNFGHRRVFNGEPRAPHSGADLRAAMGTEVHASNRGRVVLAKNLFFSGNAVFVDHGLGVYSTYLHLSKILVSPGDMVERGQVIGISGATGRVTGPHLHWGVRILDARVDPFSLLGLAPVGAPAVSP
jgi:murein DD-endopeptidase MepM/ murein hydrolase activator NlpD